MHAYFSSPISNITPAMASVAMSRQDSRDSNASTSNHYTSYASTSAHAALMSVSPPSRWSSSQPMVRIDSNTSTMTSFSTQMSSVAMRRDSSSSSWMPSPYRSCMSTYGTEPSSYLSDDDLLCSSDDLDLPVETIPTLTPKKELTTEEQIAFMRELQEKEAASQPQHLAGQARDGDARRRVVRFASHDTPSSSKSRRSSTVKRRQISSRRNTSQLNGPQ